MSVDYWGKMRCNKGFLLFELICSLVILITGIQAIYFVQVATWRTICRVSQDQQNFAQGANTIEQKKLNIERDYAVKEVAAKVFTQEESQKIIFHFPGQRRLVVSDESNCIVIKDKTTAQILLVG